MKRIYPPLQKTESVSSRMSVGKFLLRRIPLRRIEWRRYCGCEPAKLHFALLIFFLLFLGLTGSAAAQTPTTACTTPTVPGNVFLTYPACVGVQCYFDQATCTWDASTGAATYTVTVTEIDSGAVVKSESLASTVLTYTFPVTANKTYKCDINGVNSCGTAGAIGTYSLLCEADVATPSSTLAPTTVPVTAAPPPVVGSNTMLFAAGAIVLLFVIAGGFLLAL